MAQWFGAFDDRDHKVNAGVLGGAERNFFNAGVLGGAEWNFFLTIDKF